MPLRSKPAVMSLRLSEQGRCHLPSVDVRPSWSPLSAQPHPLDLAETRTGKGAIGSDGGCCLSSHPGFAMGLLHITLSIIRKLNSIVLFGCYTAGKHFPEVLGNPELPSPDELLLVPFCF
ncbi:hypothetical protein EJB05_05315 [Eragrostis curvula]|uniref:Uncharacterized protein n=1 Tax=Eragrostis curvula TaxID=38414 RepID=A0A5J9WAP6_9POAL|nr:hypothetical protein EJB05_05315 [Eragrostis curvula]